MIHHTGLTQTKMEPLLSKQIITEYPNLKGAFHNNFFNYVKKIHF